MNLGFNLATSLHLLLIANLIKCFRRLSVINRGIKVQFISNTFAIETQKSKIHCYAIFSFKRKTIYKKMVYFL